MYNIFALYGGFEAVLLLINFMSLPTVFILLFIIYVTIIYCCVKYSNNPEILYKLHKFYMGELLKLSYNE